MTAQRHVGQRIPGIFLHPRLRPEIGFAVVFAAFLSAPQSASALSEIKDAPAAADEPASETPPPSSVPRPDPVENLPALEDDPIDLPADDAGGGLEPPPDVTRPQLGVDMELPEILYDTEMLPEPVRRMRELIMEACRSGDVENLRPLIGTGEERTQLALGGLGTDPIAFLRELSGDDEGQEILAILLEVLEAGYVHQNEGEPSELYVWPYFFAMPLEALDARQRVELFTLVTAGDYEDMKTFGAYIFYRVGITPDGRWLFFVAGD